MAFQHTEIQTHRDTDTHAHKHKHTRSCHLRGKPSSEGSVDSSILSRSRLSIHSAGAGAMSCESVVSMRAWDFCKPWWFESMPFSPQDFADQLGD